ncbi:hypothetical protein MBLNU457_2105t1 [Dothideomycetes sp. NU457]
MKLPTFLLIPALLLSSLAIAKPPERWINCSGSKRCKHDGQHKGKLRPNPTLLDLIYAASWQINDTKTYHDQEYAACVTPKDINNKSKTDKNIGLCAYPFATGDGLSGAKIKQLLNDLEAWHCRRCGMVSMSSPLHLDLGMGHLAVNTVDNIMWMSNTNKSMIAEGADTLHVFD